MIASERTHMTLAEFRQLPESNLPTELIDGELIMSPSPVDLHQDVTLNTATLVKRIGRGGKTKISPLDVYLGSNVLQPDVFWVSDGNPLCTLGDDGFWYGAPDLTVEVVSPSSTNRDHRRKFQIYEKQGVREYWIIEPLAKIIYVFVRKDEAFEELGVFKIGDTFTSPLFNTVVSVGDLFV